MLRTNILGYPRIGAQRELKKATEAYWAGKSSKQELQQVAMKLRQENWETQKQAGIDHIPSNDFSIYDQILDTIFTFGAIPERYHPLIANKSDENELDLYFAMARGTQQDGIDLKAMEMTKWFDTNYHYIVPEFVKDQQFSLFSEKIIQQFYEAKSLGIQTKPVIIGPISFLLLGKEKEKGFHRLDLLDKLLPVYEKLLVELKAYGANWIQIDEPFLALDLDEKTQSLYKTVYQRFNKAKLGLDFILTTYFAGLKDNLTLALSLPVAAIHVDLVRDSTQLASILDHIGANQILSLGVVDGRNIWKNDLEQTVSLVNKAVQKLGESRVWVASSCSLVHSPCDLDLETNEEVLSSAVKNWMAFAKQKLTEVSDIAALAMGREETSISARFERNKQAQQERKTSPLIHREAVKNRLKSIQPTDDQRQNTFDLRKKKQQSTLNLPEFPTTTIGSFPQTKEVRSWRAKLKKGTINQSEYDDLIKQETTETIRWQESTGIDVLVHGEFERNDMVEYFGEQLDGYAFTQNGWVQSYGSRCVKPPVLYGDVCRPKDMTVFWTTFAQSLTQLPVKGMLTGPVTILQWSFVRNDQSRSDTAFQIAFAIRDEVIALEQAGIRIIQIDEPAIREGLPLRKADQQAYLNWAVKAFRLSASGVADETQIHTHMCYSEFNDIIADIAAMDADVITIETSRSQMELLDAFANFNYPNDIGPGVYDIHSPRVPSTDEMVDLLRKAQAVIPAAQLWVNPDCGLKTRAWPETTAALEAMVAAAKVMRLT